MIPRSKPAREKSNKGDVQLSGFVDNQGQINRAVEVARGAENARRVSNEMNIKKQGGNGEMIRFVFATENVSASIRPRVVVSGSELSVSDAAAHCLAGS